MGKATLGTVATAAVTAAAQSAEAMTTTTAAATVASASAASAMPRPGWSAFSPCGTFFASAASLSLQQETQPEAQQKCNSANVSLPRSRIRVWRCTGAANSAAGDEATAAAEGSLEFQRQFMGHSICQVVFVELPSGSSKSSKLLLVIGTEAGMIAAMDCMNGGALMFSLHLNVSAEAAAAEEDDETAAMAAAATAAGDGGGGAGGTAVRALLPLPSSRSSSSSGSELLVLLRRSPAVSSLVIIDLLHEGQVLRGTDIARGFAQAILVQRDPTERQLVILSSGSSSQGSSSSSNIVVFDLEEQKLVAKLQGGSAAFSAVAADATTGLVAAICCRGTHAEQQQQQVALWRLPPEVFGENNKKTTLKKLKIPVWGVVAYHQRLLQLALLHSLSSVGTPQEQQHAQAPLFLTCLTEQQQLVCWLVDTAAAAVPSAPLLSILTQGAAAAAGSSLALTASPGREHSAATGVFFMQQQLMLQRQVLLVARGDLLAPFFHIAELRGSAGEAAAKEKGEPLVLPTRSSCRDDKCGLQRVEPVQAEGAKRDRRRTSVSGGRLPSSLTSGEEASAAANAIMPNDAALSSLKRGALSTVSGKAGESQKRQRQEAAVAAAAASTNSSSTNSSSNNVGSILRQALLTADVPLLESILSQGQLKKKEIAAAAAALTPSHALSLLQLLVQQQQQKPSSSICKGPWIEEIVKHHAPSLACTPDGRQQLVLLQKQLQQRRQVEGALVKIKARVELLMLHIEQREQQLMLQQKMQQDALQPLIEHTEAP
ncbi:uncharacterized protein LOC34619946 [Cyclospora cayetanensis]|uniref:Uncharacterized protein LOC34619946 n=1 Tax=Cyclospora cayetanensis TaxID=88456 RepID=A0A6P6S4E1_9EIME|nr:uncharacterized protein LOC34619946 [Cyclospora cayetanensis]